MQVQCFRDPATGRHYAVVVNDDFQHAQATRIRLDAKALRLTDVIHNVEIELEKAEGAADGSLGRLTLKAGEGNDPRDRAAGRIGATCIDRWLSLWGSLLVVGRSPDRPLLWDGLSLLWGRSPDRPTRFWPRVSIPGRGNWETFGRRGGTGRRPAHNLELPTTWSCPQLGARDAGMGRSSHRAGLARPSSSRACRFSTSLDKKTSPPSVAMIAATEPTPESVSPAVRFGRCTVLARH